MIFFLINATDQTKRKIRRLCTGKVGLKTEVSPAGCSPLEMVLFGDFIGNPTLAWYVFLLVFLVCNNFV